MKFPDGRNSPAGSSCGFPRFVNELRDVNGQHFTPLSCIGTSIGIPYVIAAQWLYVPQFVEYRGGFFGVMGTGGLIEDSLQIVDDWYDSYSGNVSKLERNVNLFALWGLFVGTNTGPYEDDLSSLAGTLARVWSAFLKVEIPDRNFYVEILDDDEYGAEVTFYSQDGGGAVGADSPRNHDCHDLRPIRVTSPGDFPWFVNELRDINGPGFTPLSYVNMDEGIPYVIAAQWLYVPSFVEYRDGLFRAVHPGGLVEDNLGTLDDWFTAYDGDIASVERTVNTLGLWDLFVGNDTGPYEADLLPMAMTIARAWDALLRVEFPDREFEVKVMDSDAYGPQVTFSSRAPDGQSPKWVPKVTEYAVNRNLDGSVRGTSESGITRPATPDEIP